MKRQVRHCVFETNSSSVHSITMCLQSDYDRWVAGGLIFDSWDHELVEITPAVMADANNRYKRYLTYDQFHDWDYIEYEKFATHQTINGTEVVAFGYYGHD